jgi:hypothetical protein
MCVIIAVIDGSEPTSPRSPLSPGPMIDGAVAISDLSLTSTSSGGTTTAASSAAAAAAASRERKERAGSLYRPAPSLVAYSASQVTSIFLLSIYLHPIMNLD